MASQAGFTAGTKRTATAGDSLAARFGIVMVTAGLFAIFALTAGPFATGANLRNILEQVTVIGVVAIGETAVMLTGGIDLSVGSSVLLSSVVMSVLVVNQGWPAAPAILAGVGAALVVGLVNGLVSVLFRIEAIIVTLGTLLAAGGLGQILLNNTWVTLHSNAFTDLAVVSPLGIPLMAWVMFSLYGLASLIMYRTTFGRGIYLIGGNRAAARLSGLAVGTRLVGVYALSGLLSGVAGYLQAGQLGIISQNDGSGMEFSAILAVLVGGLSVKTGGIGRVERSLVGTLIAGMIANYFILQGVPEPYEQAAIGFVILVAVLADHLMRRSEAW
jgi:ribose transport system permease protein